MLDTFGCWFNFFVCFHSHPWRFTGLAMAVRAVNAPEFLQPLGKAGADFSPHKPPFYRLYLIIPVLDEVVSTLHRATKHEVFIALSPELWRLYYFFCYRARTARQINLLGFHWRKSKWRNVGWQGWLHFFVDQVSIEKMVGGVMGPWDFSGWYGRVTLST